MKKNKLNKEESGGEMNNENDLNEKKPLSGSDVTREDLDALGPADDNLSMDLGDDELLKGRDYDFSGDDLDVPGSELDDDEEEIGEEDEENNPYSLGGDDHDDLEEDSTEMY